jgi:ATP-dependent DNA ligase
MKAVPFEEKRLNKWIPPFIVQPKYDGVRCRALKLENGNVLLLSSEENPIFSVPHINFNLAKLHFKELDGELYCHGMPFENIISITSREQNLHSDFAQIKYHIFDVISNQTQMERTLELSSMPVIANVTEVAPFWICDNLDEIMRVFDGVCKEGYEGIIVRNILAHYERKRSTWVMKFKPHQEDQYEITGYAEEYDKEGLGKGSLGALVCKSGDGNTFAVGTGFSAEQRQIFWDIRDQLPGKTAKVKYQHITSGMKVPRFPVFVEIL